MYKRIAIVLISLIGVSVLFAGKAKPSYAQSEAAINAVQACYDQYQKDKDLNATGICIKSVVETYSSEVDPTVLPIARACFDNAIADPAANFQSVLGCMNKAFPGFIFVPRPVGALDSLPTILSAGIRLILIVAGLIAFFILLMGGIKWITSGGDKGQVEAARGQILQALIGLIVVLATWGLIVIVQAATNICLGFGCDLVLPTLY